MEKFSNSLQKNKKLFVLLSFQKALETDIAPPVSQWRVRKALK